VPSATACSQPFRLAALAAFALAAPHGLVDGTAEAQATAQRLARLSWSAPGDGDCPSQDAIERAVESHLGRRVFARSGAQTELRVDTRVVREGERFVAVLRTGDRERRLVSAADHCAAIAGPVALVLSLLVDLPAQRSTLRLPPPARRPWRLQASAGVAGARGLLPGFSLAGTLAAALLSPGDLLLIEPSVWLWAPRERHEDGSGARWSAWSGALAVCPRFWSTAALALRACGDAQVGSLQASGLMLEAPLQPARLWLAAGARLRLELQLAPPVGLRAEAGAEFPLLRDAFHYEGRGGSKVQLHRVPALLPLAVFAIFVRPS